MKNKKLFLIQFYTNKTDFENEHWLIRLVYAKDFYDAIGVIRENFEDADNFKNLTLF
jgi:hypothetical protein